MIWNDKACHYRFTQAAVYSVATGTLPAYWGASSAAGFGIVQLAKVLPVAVPALIGAVVGGTVGGIGYGLYSFFSGSPENTQQRNAEPEPNNCIIF
ncbi:MAG: hypothetical protein H0U73_13295 [Tatlockia sp.]|nr:hypothetical protein [Tatlockia sp.]